jgi:hypothetical protein
MELRIRVREQGRLSPGLKILDFLAIRVLSGTIFSVIGNGIIFAHATRKIVNSPPLSKAERCFYSEALRLAP